MTGARGCDLDSSSGGSRADSDHEDSFGSLQARAGASSAAAAAARTRVAAALVEKQQCTSEFAARLDAHFSAFEGSEAAGGRACWRKVSGCSPSTGSAGQPWGARGRQLAVWADPLHASFSPCHLAPCMPGCPAAWHTSQQGCPTLTTPLPQYGHPSCAGTALAGRRVGLLKGKAGFRGVTRHKRTQRWAWLGPVGFEVSCQALTPSLKPPRPFGLATPARLWPAAVLSSHHVSASPHRVSPRAGLRATSGSPRSRSTWAASIRRPWPPRHTVSQLEGASPLHCACLCSLRTFCTALLGQGQAAGWLTSCGWGQWRRVPAHLPCSAPRHPCVCLPSPCPATLLVQT